MGVAAGRVRVWAVAVWGWRVRLAAVGGLSRSQLRCPCPCPCSKGSRPRRGCAECSTPHSYPSTAGLPQTRVCRRSCSAAASAGAPVAAALPPPALPPAVLLRAPPPAAALAPRSARPWMALKRPRPAIALSRNSGGSASACALGAALRRPCLISWRACRDAARRAPRSPRSSAAPVPKMAGCWTPVGPSYGARACPGAASERQSSDSWC